MLLIMSLWGMMRVGFGSGSGTVDVTTTEVFEVALVLVGLVFGGLFVVVVGSALGPEFAFVVAVVLDVVEAFDVVFALALGSVVACEVVFGFVLVAKFEVAIDVVVVTGFVFA